MKRFHIRRLKDIHGTSGEGIICEGCQFTNGKVAIQWLGKYKSSVLWDCLEDFISIMDHDGNTVVEWIDVEG